MYSIQSQLIRKRW